MSKIVLFDLGGVLVNWKDEWLFAEITKQFDIEHDVLKSRFDQNIGSLFTGKVTEENFWQVVLHGYTNSKNYIIIDSLFSTKYSINENILYEISILKKTNVAYGLLSNITAPTRKFLDQTGLFNDFKISFFSDLLGLAKPEPEIYQYVLNSLYPEYDSILFVDDKEENITAAQKFGFETILYSPETEIGSKIAQFLNK